MLSYQHAYHAGNLADVHKHALLARMLGYLAAKDKPFTYLETHAGRGLYRLDAEAARKTGEALAGIGRVAGWFGADHPYARALATVRQAEGPTAYPGSPRIAAALLRPGDPMHLAELHPQEHAALRDAMAGTRAQVHRRDGAELALSLCPPTPRRGMVLIDPSYEVKDDYDRMADLVLRLHRKWNVGVIALWYPVLVSGAERGLAARLTADLPAALIHEVRFPPARPGHGMIGSGMVMLNAPWGTEDEARWLTDRFAGLGG